MERRSGTERRSNPDLEPELTYRDKRVEILVQFQLQKTPNLIIQDFQSALGPQAPSKAMVYKCIKRFRSGHLGRLHSVIVQDSIHAMKELLDQDRRFTIQETHRQTLQISNGTLLTIINDYLGLGKFLPDGYLISSNIST